MRKPSTRALNQRVDIYTVPPGVDASGGPQYVYPTGPTYQQVPCSVQFVGIRLEEQRNRLTQITDYRILARQQLNVGARAKVLWTDNGGVVHTMYTQISKDKASRGAAFDYLAEEYD